MNKTIFNFNYKISVIIVASLGILLGFLANAFYVNTFLSYIFYVFRSLLFVGIYIVLYLLEKKCIAFKDACKRMIGYLTICYTFNLLCTLFSLTHILKTIFLTVSGLVCFWTILVFLVELLNLFLKQKWLIKMQSVNEKIGLAIANPIVKLVQIKATND